LHTAQLMPLPLTVSCFSKIQIGFTFLVPAHPGSPGKRAIKRLCVCVCVCVCVGGATAATQVVTGREDFFLNLLPELGYPSTLRPPWTSATPPTPLLCNWRALIYWLHRPPRSQHAAPWTHHVANDISIGSCALAQLTSLTNRLTDREP